MQKWGTLNLVIVVKGDKFECMMIKNVEKMYKAHASKKQILLWCYSQPTIQKRSTDSQEKSDKVNTISGYLTRRKKINAIYAQLEEKLEGSIKQNSLIHGHTCCT